MLTYRVTARMTAGPSPAVDDERRTRFNDAIASLASSKYLLHARVEWEKPDRARVVIGCVASDRHAAESTAKSIVTRNAQNIANIAVDHVDIVDVTLVDKKR